MPKPRPIEQSVGNGDAMFAGMSSDYTLLYLVAALLVIFYVVIMWIVSSADRDRINRLESLSNKKK